MKTYKSSLSINIIYWITTLSLFFAFIAIIALIVVNVLIFINSGENSISLNTSIPNAMNINEIGTLQLNNQEINVKLVDATAKISFINTSKEISQSLALIGLFVIFGFTYLLWIFSTFINNVKKGIIFTIDNIKTLKKLAYGIAIYWLFTIIYSILFNIYITQQLHFKAIEFTSQISTYQPILFASIGLWVLAHIFGKGLALQKEQDLTI